MRIERKNEKVNKMRVFNPLRDNLAFEVDSDTNDLVHYTVSSVFGQTCAHGQILPQKGVNKLNQTLSKIPAGDYVLIISTKTSTQSTSFIKLN